MGVKMLIELTLLMMTKIFFIGIARIGIERKTFQKRASHESFQRWSKNVGGETTQSWTS